jgi:DNA-binding transcriptional regulator YiaG
MALAIAGKARSKARTATQGSAAYSARRAAKIGIQMTVLLLAQAAGVDVEAIRRLGGLSQAELARVSGYSARAIAGWEAGAPLAGAGRRAMIELRRLLSALAELMPAAEIGNWLRNPNPSFDDISPMHVIERGESDRLWEMIHQIGANVAN